MHWGMLQTLQPNVVDDVWFDRGIDVADTSHIGFNSDCAHITLHLIGFACHIV